MNDATFVKMHCPHCRQHERLSDDGLTPMVDTRDALGYRVIPNGIEWHGAPCHTCGKTYTIQSVRDEE